jgi:hypothetical protein
VRALLVCGVIAGPLFIVGFLIEGALTPDYDPLRHPVSSLALGPFGWTQTANFMIAGLLTLAFAIGLIRLPGARQENRGDLGRCLGSRPARSGSIRHRSSQRISAGNAATESRGDHVRGTT